MEASPHKTVSKSAALGAPREKTKAIFGFGSPFGLGIAEGGYTPGLAEILELDSSRESVPNFIFSPVSGTT
jgi:hypothetical protein